MFFNRNSLLACANNDIVVELFTLRITQYNRKLFTVEKCVFQRSSLKIGLRLRCHFLCLIWLCFSLVLIVLLVCVNLLLSCENLQTFVESNLIYKVEEGLKSENLGAVGVEVDLKNFNHVPC